jgi:hypothetical protein
LIVELLRSIAQIFSCSAPQVVKDGVLVLVAVAPGAGVLVLVGVGV